MTLRVSSRVAIRSVNAPREADWAFAFAATGTRPTAVLTGPRHRIRHGPGPAPPGDPAGGTYDMVPRRIGRHPLAAIAGLVWSADLPRQLQQVLFDTAETIGS